jgi:hypothetical protein
MVAMQAPVATERIPVHRQPQPHQRVRAEWLLSLIGIVSFLACYGRTFVLPHTPIMFWGDQLLYATNGARIIAGQMPYRDFFEFLPAGTDLVYASLFRIFGVRLWIPNLLMDMLAAAAVLLTTIAGRTILHGRYRLAPALFALGFGLYAGLDATHHWFSGVAALGAMAVLLGGTSWKRVAGAGALCGVAASFTQSKGAAVTFGFVIYLAWRSIDQNERDRWRKPLLLCASAMVVFLAFNLHYMLTLGLKEWCRWVVIFPLRYYATMPGQTFTAPLVEFESRHGLMRWAMAGFLYAVVPSAYVALLWMWRRRRQPDQPWDQLVLICITGMAMFLSVTGSLSMMRVSTASLPAAVLLGWYLQRMPGRFGWIKVAVAGLAAASALNLVLGTQRAQWYRLSLPAGDTAIAEPGKYELYAWLKDHTYSGEAYFGIAPISLPLALRCPAPIQQPGPWEYYRPEHIARSVTALEEHRVPVLVLRSYSQYENRPGYDPTRLQELEKYVETHYRLVRRVSTGDQVWERIVEAQPGAGLR